MRALLTRCLLLLVALLLATPAFARGGKLEIQILDIASPDAIENARALTIALERAVTRTDSWKLAPGDYSLEVLTAALDCAEPPDPECLGRIANEIESDRFIWGVLSRQGGEVAAELHLWEEGKDKASTTLRYSANLNDAAEDALFQLAQRAIGELLGVAGGTLMVVAGNGGGEVMIDGQPRGSLTGGRLELKLPAGDHEVLVRAPGYREARGRVTVPPGDRAEIALDMFSDGEPVVAEEPSPERARSSPRRALGYGLIGVGAAVAVAGGVFTGLSAAQRDDEEFAEYRSTVPVGEDVCEVADERGDDDIVDKCDANVLTRRMAYILTPSGLVVAGVGIALVATAHPRERVAARPGRTTGELRLGPRGGYVGVAVRF
ncbi:MAG TPA: PEGA domain-containing protein [Polyangiaceae bacterium]|nr:PEGA domain-containing protein [Polyangiaceae bacterium]